MNLSIIIPTKEREEVFNKTIQGAIQAIDGLEAEIVVVNDSKSGQPVIPVGFQHVRLLNNPKQGVASARNLGARESTGSLLLFLDNDILITAASIRQILEVHQQMKHVALNLNWVYPPAIMEMLHRSSFGRFLETHQLTTFKGWYGDSSWEDHKLFSSVSVASFHLSLPREDFERAGGYDEQFPYAGFEDYDFPLRLKKAGVSFLIDARHTVYHNELDRTKMEAWLDNEERRASTRAVAVHRGYSALALKYSLAKKVVLSLLLLLYPLIGFVLRLVPNKSMFDPLVFNLVGALQAARIYRGYSAGAPR